MLPAEIQLTSEWIRDEVVPVVWSLSASQYAPSNYMLRTYMNQVNDVPSMGFQYRLRTNP